MTDSTLQLLSDFRAEIAEPDDETARRIFALATAPAARRRHGTERPWRARRSRVVLTALVAAALLAVPTALALGGKLVDLFRGTPAPAEISTTFGSQNRMADTMADFATRQGFALSTPHADVSRAHGVIEVQTPDGPLDLWAAPSDRGGNCYFVDYADDPSNGREKLGIGGCDPSPPPASKINWGQVWLRSHPDLVTVWGSVFVDAARVRVALEGGQTLDLPVVEGLFLGSLARGAKVEKVTAFDASGNEVAEWAKPA